MAIKAIVDALDSVDASLHDLYEEKDGKYVLSIESLEGHPAQDGLKRAKDRLLSEKKDLATRLSAAETRLASIPEDFDAEEWSRLRAEDEARAGDPEGKDIRKQIETATAAVRTQLEAKIDAVKRKAETTLAERDAKISALEGDLRRVLIEDGLTKALVTAGVDKNLLDGAKAMLERRVEVVEEDGVRVARVKADFGGDDLDQYVASWVQTDGKAYVPPARGGDETGSSPALRPGEANPFAKATWNKTAQAKLKANPAQAERLAKMAGFTDANSGFSALRPIEA